MLFNIFIEPLALEDIQSAIDSYEDKQDGLGKRFLEVFDSHIKGLRLNPFFQIRYDNVRCLPMKTFPYMIHFTVNEKTNSLEVKAVFCTHKDPGNWIR